MFKFLLQNFVQIGLGVSMIANLYLGYQRIQLGGYVIRKEIFEDYKERNKQLEDKIKDLFEEIHRTNVDLASLRATVGEKNKRIDDLTKQMEVRNPQLMAVLNEIKIFLRDIKKANIYQTDILDNQVKREKNIDDSSQGHTGDLLRINKK